MRILWKVFDFFSLCSCWGDHYFIPFGYLWPYYDRPIEGVCRLTLWQDGKPYPESRLSNRKRKDIYSWQLAKSRRITLAVRKLQIPNSLQEFNIFQKTTSPCGANVNRGCLEGPHGCGKALGSHWWRGQGRPFTGLGNANWKRSKAMVNTKNNQQARKEEKPMP